MYKFSTEIDSMSNKGVCVMTFKSSKDSGSHSGPTGIEAVLVECCTVLCPFFSALDPCSELIPSRLLWQHKCIMSLWYGIAKLRIL